MNQVHRRRTWRPHLAFAAVLALTAGLSFPAGAAGGVADAPIVQPEQPALVVQGSFRGEKEKDVAEDLSGIACRPPSPNGTRQCLVVNDEGVTAQPVVIDRGRLMPGTPPLELIDADPPTAVLGFRPEIKCANKGPKKFKEFDGEGVAFAPASAAGDGYFYVVGSHGCSRKKDAFKASSFLLARLPVDAAGKFGKVALTWRVSEALDRTPAALRGKVGKSLDKEDGLNIEGIAAIGDRLLFGLRAPSIDKKGHVVSVPVAQLFASGSGEAVSQPIVHELPLGEGAGVRDLAALPDGKLLVLSGPTREQPSVPYALSVFDAGTNDHRWLGRLADVPNGHERAKAEAVVVLGLDDKTLRVLVLFDGVQNGRPGEYRLRY